MGRLWVLQRSPLAVMARCRYPYQASIRICTPHLRHLRHPVPDDHAWRSRHCITALHRHTAGPPCPTPKGRSQPYLGAPLLMCGRDRDCDPIGRIIAPGTMHVSPSDFSTTGRTRLAI